MPELPEVETIKRGLTPKIIGLKITKIEVLNIKSFSGDSKVLIGATITNVWRRAKILGIDLQTANSEQLTARKEKSIAGRQPSAESGQLTLLIHLKMSGQIIFTKNLKLENLSAHRRIKNSKSERFGGGHPTKDMMGEMPNRFTRVIFTLTSPKNLKPETYHLYFNDQRKFGWIKVVPTADLPQDSFLQKLGPEPLEKAFTSLILKSVLMRHPKMPIKVAILDQSAIAGIGNIYASEACFLAKIHPTTPVTKLTDPDYTKLHQGIIQSLESSIKYGGSSKHTYVNEAGEKGYFLDIANVYDRKGLMCRICSSPIEKITLGGRGTYYCSHCQPKLD